jgi:hypothetical protein
VNEAAKQTRTVGGRPPRLVPVDDSLKASQYAVTSYAASQVVTVLPTEIDLNIYQGDDFYLDMVVTDQNSNPIDLTNAQPQSQIRAAPGGAAVLAEIDITLDGTQNNLLHLHLQSSDSSILPPQCAWDLQLSSPSVTTIAAGAVTVRPQVTQ